MTHDYDQERAIAVAAVREAAALTRAVQTEMAPRALEKKDRSPVTVADFGSQALVCRALAEAFPDDPVMAEEDSAALRVPENAARLEEVVEHVRRLRPEADAPAVCRWIDRGNLERFAPRFWTLDPIDGTKGFLRGGHYAVALALIVEGRIEVAALACPNLPFGPDGPIGAVFAAVRGQGTEALRLGAGAGRPARVSPTDDPSRARLCESVESGHSKHDAAAAAAERLGITAAPVRLDSQVKYAAIARGDAEIYLRLPTRGDYVERVWDHAAGALVVTEAGGRVTDTLGRPLDFTHGQGLEANRGVVATNGRLHAQVLAALA